MVTELQAHFDLLFSAEEDPWNYRSSWPERRRLDLLVAMLPQEHYDSIFEPACANGSLTARLAARSARVVAWDSSLNALAHAQRHVAPYSHVELANKSVPEKWPGTPFDLVVLSDFLYYLPEENIIDVANLSAQTIVPGGSIVACHWRWVAHDFRVAGGDAVHAMLTDVIGPPLAGYVDDRQIIDVWTP